MNDYKQALASIERDQFEGLDFSRQWKKSDTTDVRRKRLYYRRCKLGFTTDQTFPPDHENDRVEPVNKILLSRVSSNATSGTEKYQEGQPFYEGHWFGSLLSRLTNPTDDGDCDWSWLYGDLEDDLPWERGSGATPHISTRFMSDEKWAGDSLWRFQIEMRWEVPAEVPSEILSEEECFEVVDVDAILEAVQAALLDAYDAEVARNRREKRLRDANEMVEHYRSEAYEDAEEEGDYLERISELRKQIREIESELDEDAQKRALEGIDKFGDLHTDPDNKYIDTDEGAVEVTKDFLSDEENFDRSTSGSGLPGHGSFSDPIEREDVIKDDD